jgi:mannose-1-phosphate guanylyltransferase
MIIVIIAGGSGTRLWPLSQGAHPKHLLALMNERSLLQNTYDRAKDMASEIFIATEASHSEEVRKQLPELSHGNILVEPGRRGTASVIALVLAQLKKRFGVDETIVFLHADHHIMNTELFCRTVNAAAEASAKTNAVALIGLKPTHPATGFGYIQTDAKLGEITEIPYFSVNSFKEKPAHDVATSYVASGDYLWNLGLFTATINVFEQAMKSSAPDLYDAYSQLGTLHAKKLEEYYMGLPNQPIDTALIEKTKSLIVLPGTFDWADIGSFFDLHNILKNAEGNVVEGNIQMIHCEDSMIHGTDKPIIAIGLSGIVVVDTPEGLLVCSKEQSQLVGDLVKKLKTDK